ncbi:MAG: SpoIIE family protein phosphatase [Deltaproteobacteria bacterium]|nr:SpoIIE family protein phosphatase [Deltaproteobacteria bacterium]MBW1923878.1 SpoIIE family protein phosphatase [Deltaproteobacteria bacterium]MBW2007348.1 SpoIIE family protein phosphatase [Deltaproteobacteria bacterium]MBW2347959.1 SpoIIE family protein phosphatase [Deltaproteobacteria bacterium]RLB31140.1 MAG: LacI family transcriptional regulator [Deltaproteobacteria bacterium]
MANRETDIEQFSFEAKDFETYLTGIIHDWSKVLTTLAFTLVPVFFILDYFTMPEELLPRFGIYRLVSTVIVLVQYFIIRHTKPSKSSYYHGYFVSINVGGIIALMTMDLGGFDSSYYAGLNLVIIGVNLLLPWRAVHSAANSLIIISLYLFFNLLGGKAFSTSSLVDHLFFLCSTAIIAVSINHVKYKLVKKEFSLLVELKNARDALWSEMELAKRIQTALLPKKDHMSGYEIAAAMYPAKEVGGDYYDIIETPAGDKWVTMGDVSGHGVDSGLIMMMAQTSITSMVCNNSNCGPSKVLGSVNRVIRENLSRMGSDHYMTMMALRLNETSFTFSGKHQDIIIYRSRRNRTEVIPTKGTWLGIADQIDKYLEDTQVRINDGDVLLLFSDGITEATSLGGDMYGQERLEAALNQYADLPVVQILEKLIAQVNAFQDQQTDDMTMVVIKKTLT